MKTRAAYTLRTIALSIVMLPACGGDAANENPPASDAGIETQAASECETLGGTCVGAALSCPEGGELVSTPQSGCPLQGGCCLPSCPSSAPIPNEPCSAKGLRCSYTQPQCIISTCIGSSWYMDVYQCPTDAGTGD
jgi:hypothetical protein